MQSEPRGGVSHPAGAHSPPSPATPQLNTGVLPPDFCAQVDFPALFLELSPRAAIRVDTPSGDGGWLHSYKERPLPKVAPAGPYAVFLADRLDRFQWLLFDLDSSKGDTGPDLATLLRWLEEAGLTYVVAASGSAGGRHVWVTAAERLDAVLVRGIAEAAAERLPTLDRGMLCNPVAGAARPIGAPHRHGGRSELQAPLDQARAAELLTPATCRNSSEAFTRLALIIDAVPGPAARPRLLRPADPVVEVIDDGEGPHLPGTPNTLLDDETMALLTRRPAADRVSETLASLFARLALRRWRLGMVEELLEDTRHREGGLLHLCTRPSGDTDGLRVVLHEQQVRERLRYQWGRCVAYAATLPHTEESAQWTERMAQVVEDVEAIQAAADAWPERWATEAGPADRAALDARCLYALRAGTLTLALDVRRAAIATGYGRSTMHRANDRLSLDCWHTETVATGPAAAHELLPITEKHPAFLPTVGGGTQRTPPPHKERRELLISHLQERLSAGRADLFSHGRPSLGHSGGLGHHVGRTFQQLAEHAHRPLSLDELVERTGYTARTVARHLARMRDLMVVTRAVMVVHHECPTCEARPGEKCRVYGRTVRRREKKQQHATRQQLTAQRAAEPFYRPRPGSLVPAAKALGVHGRTAARARRYTVEIEVFHWWQREEERMHAEKTGVRTGVQTHQDQQTLTITTLPRQPVRAYPRTADGSADHAAARLQVLRRIATA